MMFDITPHQEYIKRRISDGASMRMLEKEIGVSRKTLSRAMKRCGMRVPTVVLTRAEHIKIHRDLLNQSRRKENA